MRINSSRSRTSSTSFSFHLNIRNHINSLVDESGGIGPQEKDGQREDEAVAHQGEEMVLHDLEQEPDGGGTSKDTAGDLLVPP